MNSPATDTSHAPRARYTPHVPRAPSMNTSHYPRPRTRSFPSPRTRSLPRPHDHNPSLPFTNTSTNHEHVSSPHHARPTRQFRYSFRIFTNQFLNHFSLINFLIFMIPRSSIFRNARHPSVTRLFRKACSFANKDSLKRYASRKRFTSSR